MKLAAKGSQRKLSCLLLRRQFFKMLECLKILFPDPVINEEDFENYKRAKGLYIEDPWERVMTIFQKDQFGNLHPEMMRAIQSCQFGLILGGGWGAIKEAGNKTREFIRTNDTNVYLSKNELYRVMTNKSILAMGQGAIKGAPRIGLLTGGVMLLASCCEAYRNKSGIIEYVVGGFFCGGISKTMFGIKGFIAGGVVGAILGLTYGVIRVGVEKIYHKDTLVLKYSQYAYIKHKRQLFDSFRTSTGLNDSDKLMSSIHGDHVRDPLNELKS